MFTMTIARKILGIALMLIVLMAGTSLVSTFLVIRTGERLDDIVENYIPAYGDLARTNIRSLERALALRTMIIEKLLKNADTTIYDAANARFEGAGKAAEKEAASSRALINGLLDRGVSKEDVAKLARIDIRIQVAMDKTRSQLSEEIGRLQLALDTDNPIAFQEGLARVRKGRAELNEQLESIRSDMLALLVNHAEGIKQDLRNIMIVSFALTFLAAAIGVTFSILVSGKLTQPVRRLLESARSVAAGRLDHPLVVESQDEIGRLTVEFNHMVDQLREKESLRETFGKYVDPRIVEGLMNRPDLAREGQRRVMTVMFCDVKGFTHASEQLTPNGLVKIMNRYFSVMSEAIRQQGGVIDKYIGDAIMAYWGAPFVIEADQTRLATLAALEMRKQLDPMRAGFPELIGLRELPMAFDIRIGIATGEALVGSIGSDIMMNYTVMGDTVNLASRLEGVNKAYGSDILISEATVVGAKGAIEVREIDSVVVLGQTKPQSIFEPMAETGQLSLQQAELRGLYSQGLAAYRARHWQEALSLFAQALSVTPHDGPSIAMTERINKLLMTPLKDDWDGAWHFDHK